MRAMLSVASSLLVLSSCVQHVPSPTSKHDFDNSLFEAIALFKEYRLTNSMARDPGLDLGTQLRSSEVHRQLVTRVFHTPDGVRYLASRIGREEDELPMLAILEILSESRQSSAIPVLNRFVLHENPVVSEWASSCLSRALDPNTSE